MNRIDYELGLADEQYGEEFNSADGLSVAKAVKMACSAKCNFIIRKSKRNSCFGKCSAAYNAKVSYINANISTVTADESAAAAAEAVAAAAAAAAAEAAAENATAAAAALAAQTGAGERTAAAGTKAAGEDPKKTGLSTGAKIGIGVGVLVLVGGILLMRKK